MAELKDMILTEIEGEYYAVPTGAAAKRFSGMIRMNRTGKRIFELLLEGKNEDETVRQMTEEFDVDEATARANVRAILDKLRGAGVLYGAGNRDAGLSHGGTEYWRGVSL